MAVGLSPRWRHRPQNLPVTIAVTFPVLLPGSSRAIGYLFEWERRMRFCFAFLIGIAALAGAARAFPSTVQPDWIAPIPPFPITDHVYYVGSSGLASYLIVTPQ